MKLRTLIVDDQLMGREHLRRLLQDEPEVEIVGLCATGREAVEAIRKQLPDLVFLDVHMPELNGFEVLTQLDASRMPAIIFVTANDDFAVKAFDVHALDYLVKPCKPERLQKAVKRAKTQIERQQTGALQKRLAALLDDLQPKSKHAERLAVKSSGRVLFLKAEDINWVEAADNYVKLPVGTETHLIRDTMNALEGKLSPDRFLRISRSTIVNIERIKELQPLFHGEYAVILRDGTRLTLSRNYREKLSQLGLS